MAGVKISASTQNTNPQLTDKIPVYSTGQSGTDELHDTPQQIKDLILTAEVITQDMLDDDGEFEFINMFRSMYGY